MLCKNNMYVSFLLFWVLSWPQTWPAYWQKLCRITPEWVLAVPSCMWPVTPSSLGSQLPAAPAGLPPSPRGRVLVLLLIWDLGLLKLGWYLWSVQGEAEGDWELICLKLSFRLWAWSSLIVVRKLPLPEETFPPCFFLKRGQHNPDIKGKSTWKLFL